MTRLSRALSDRESPSAPHAHVPDRVSQPSPSLPLPLAGGAAGQVALIQRLQRVYGNQAVCTLLRRQSGGGPAVQRYAEITLEGRPYRLSDQHRALARSGEGNEAPKDLFATDDLLDQARRQLQQVGSFVTLAPQGEKTLKFRGDRVATEKDIETAAYFLGQRKRGDRPPSQSEMTSDYFEGQDQLLGQGAETTVRFRGVVARYPGPTGENQADPNRAAAYTRLGQKIQQTGVLNTPADCNETARVIMGVVHGPLPAEAEVAVAGRGGVDQLSAREPTDLRKTGESTGKPRGKRWPIRTQAEPGGLPGGTAAASGGDHTTAGGQPGSVPS